MRTILVLGGTGKTGRRVVQRLETRGRPVRLGTPSATPPFDWTDEATWPKKSHFETPSAVPSFHCL